ncbi:hypothetical protein ACFOWE_06900 [Planomonospora corallina]|uniref:FtsX extracellular domain-containing protein n=1 Tax=Planomonospora corallina TaxID=1806052 RepID=A0ABV8I4B3_9ACTN
MSGHDELSFGGGDPDREPWSEARLRALREWLEARARVLTACAVVLAVLGAAGLGGRYLYERSREPLPPPEAAFPEQLEFAVMLCQGYGPGGGRCPGRPRATEADYRAVAERLRAMPELAGVVLRSPEEVRRELSARHTVTDGWEPAAGTVFDPSLQGTLRRGGDFAAVAAKVEAMPEVDSVTRLIPDFWAGKADLEVALCGQAERLRRECTENRPRGVVGAATEEEKDAIVARLWELPGAEAIYLQDRDHFMRLARHYGKKDLTSGRPLRPDHAYESLYVKLARPPGIEEVAAVARALTPLPGVLGVLPVRSDG